MVSGLGSLVQSRCGEGGALQTDVAGLCGEHSQCPSHTGFAPAHGCVLSLSTLLRLPAALYGAGPALCAVPVFRYSAKAWTRLSLFCAFPGLSSSGSQELDGRTLPGCGVPSPLLWSQPQFLGMSVRCVRLVSILGSWPLAATLLADVNHPESQEVFG